MIVMRRDHGDGREPEHRQFDRRRELASDRYRKVREAAFAMIAIAVVMVMMVSCAAVVMVVRQFMEREVERRKDERPQKERDRGKRRRSPVAQDTHCLVLASTNGARALSGRVRNGGARCQFMAAAIVRNLGLRHSSRDCVSIVSVRSVHPTNQERWKWSTHQ